MKLLFLLSLSLLLLAEQSQKTCYTVQILSEKDTPTNRENLMSRDYADGCKVMKIGHNQTVRCGCYDKKQDAKKKLVTLYDEYTEAYIMSTYKYRFDKKSNKSLTQPLKTPTKREKKVQPKIDIKTQCYSVEIFNKEKTKQNINYLTSQTFPKSCLKMNFKDSISIRCGCYKDKDRVINEYLRLKKRYKDTIIKISYANRFKKKSVDNQVYIKKIAELELLIKDLRNTIQQQELYIENMDDTEEIGIVEQKVEEVEKKEVKPKKIIVEEKKKKEETVVLKKIVKEDKEVKKIEEVEKLIIIDETDEDENIFLEDEEIFFDD